MRLLVDSDAFMKLGVVGMIEHAASLFGLSLSACERLPALVPMLRRGKLPKQYGDEVCARLAPAADLMRVTSAAPLEWAGQLAGMNDIDPGEVQLFSLVAGHGAFLVTADKRALVAVAKVRDMATVLAGKLISIEAALLGIAVRMGWGELEAIVRPRVHESKDQVLRMCFSEGNPSPGVGLRSYFDSLQREVAPLVLWQPPREISR